MDPFLVLITKLISGLSDGLTLGQIRLDYCWKTQQKIILFKADDFNQLCHCFSHFFCNCLWFPRLFFNFCTQLFAPSPNFLLLFFLLVSDNDQQKTESLYLLWARRLCYISPLNLPDPCRATTTDEIGKSLRRKRIPFRAGFHYQCDIIVESHKMSFCVHHTFKSPFLIVYRLLRQRAMLKRNQDAMCLLAI